MSGKNNSHPPMIISNIIANRPPIVDKTSKLGFTNFIPLPKPIKILATIPNHPIIGDAP